MKCPNCGNDTQRMVGIFEINEDEIQILSTDEWLKDYEEEDIDESFFCEKCILSNGMKEIENIFKNSIFYFKFNK